MQLRSQEFKSRAARSLANPHLRKALSNLRMRMVVGRVASVAELDNFEQTRDAAKQVRDNALAQLDFLLEEFERKATANGIVSSTTSTVDQYFRNPNNGVALTSDISRQLLRAARMIEARDGLGHGRQVFFVSQGGYDTHSGQTDGQGSPTTGTQANLYSDLAMALAGFYNAMKALGMQNNVTAFTMSDFGRVFKGNAQNGSDHAWGSNHLIVGGGLARSQVLGRYPDMALGGPDDIANDGRWIPSVSIEEYIGSIAMWHGVSSVDMPYVFPNWATWNGGGRGPVPFFT